MPILFNPCSPCCRNLIRNLIYRDCISNLSGVTPQVVQVSLSRVGDTLVFHGQYTATFPFKDIDLTFDTDELLSGTIVFEAGLYDTGAVTTTVTWIASENKYYGVFFVGTGSDYTQVEFYINVEDSDICCGCCGYQFLGCGGPACGQLGLSGTIVAQQTGPTTFFFNDNIFGDNAGHFDVIFDGIAYTVPSTNVGVAGPHVIAGQSYTYSADPDVLIDWSSLPNNVNADGQEDLGGGPVDNCPTSCVAAADENFICTGLHKFSWVMKYGVCDNAAYAPPDELTMIVVFNDSSTQDVTLTKDESVCSGDIPSTCFYHTGITCTRPCFYYSWSGTLVIADGDCPGTTIYFKLIAGSNRDSVPYGCFTLYFSNCQYANICNEGGYMEWFIFQENLTCDPFYLNPLSVPHIYDCSTDCICQPTQWQTDDMVNAPLLLEGGYHQAPGGSNLCGWFDNGSGHTDGSLLQLFSGNYILSIGGTSPAVYGTIPQGSWNCCSANSFTKDGGFDGTYGANTFPGSITLIPVGDCAGNDSATFGTLRCNSMSTIEITE